MPPTLHRSTRRDDARPGAQVRRPRGLVGRGHIHGPARYLARAIPAARAAGPARQRHDSGKGVDPGSDAIRGFRVLRQADARAPRSLQPALEPGDAHLRPAAECDFAGVLRRLADPLLAVGGGAADSGRTAGVPGGGEVLRRGISPVPLARSRVAHADLSGIGAGARGQRQGGQAVRAWAAPAGSLPRHFHASVSGGSRSDPAPRCLGLRPGAAGHGDAVRRLRVDRRGNRARRHDGGPDDHVPDVVSPGADGGERRPLGGQRPVRRQSLSVESVRVSRTARRQQQRPVQRAAQIPATASASRTSSSSIPAPPRPRCRASICTCGPARAWLWSGRTAPARPP